MTLHLRFALLALVLCAVLVTGARHASAAPSTTRTGSRSAVVGERAVKVARRLLGVPYRYGGSSPRGGFDCSGFVRYVYERLGIELPRTSFEQFGSGRRVASAGLRRGDLVFFDRRGHVGIYIGGGSFIHAVRTGVPVSIDQLSTDWYRARYDGARRLA